MVCPSYGLTKTPSLPSASCFSPSLLFVQQRCASSVHHQPTPIQPSRVFKGRKADINSSCSPSLARRRGCLLESVLSAETRRSPDKSSFRSRQTIMSEPLTKVDSAVQGIDVAPKEVKETKHRRASSSANGVMNINDLGKWCPQRCTHGPEASRCRTVVDFPVCRGQWD